MKLPGPELTVSVQPLDRGFVKLGSGQRYGVIPESLTYTGDVGEYGCAECNFLMKLDPRWPHPELEQFTPIVIEDGEEPVWSGRLIATPTTFGGESVVHVQCQGWGQHTKDYPIDKTWVVADLSRWSDARTSINATLTTYSQNYEIRNETGKIVVSMPQNSVVKQNTCIAGVVLDMGPNNGAKRIVFAMGAKGIELAATCTLYARVSDSRDFDNGADVNLITPVASFPAAETIYSGTAASTARYVHVFVYYTGADAALGQDCWITLKNMSVFTDAADESGNASILKATTIISESLDLGCPMFSTDRSQMVATTLSIPEFQTDGRQYPNEIIDRANALHGYLFLLSPDAVPIPSFGPLPTVPTFVLGAQDDYTFDNPAENDARTVYNGVISEFDTAGGIPSEAIASVAANAIFAATSDGSVDNPTFATVTTGWTIAGAGTPTVTRDTGVFDTTPASGRFQIAAGTAMGTDNIITGTTTGTFVAGRTYALAMSVRGTYDDVAGINIKFGNATDFGETNFNPTDSGFTVAQLTWTPSTTVTNPSITVYSYVGTKLLYIDTVTISRSFSNIVDRRGFRRAALRPVSSASTDAVATAFAQLTLDSSQFPPLKGTISIKGRIRLFGGGSIPVNRLPSMVGQAVVLEQFEDPNTGAGGRQGTIMRATYDRATDTATIEIDASGDFIDQLKNRFDLFSK